MYNGKLLKVSVYKCEWLLLAYLQFSARYYKANWEYYEERVEVIASLVDIIIKSIKIAFMQNDITEELCRK